MSHDKQNLAIVILAAGKGTRMKSDLPKVLHPLAGKPLLAYSLDAAAGLDPAKVVVVVGYKAEMVEQAFASRPGLGFVVQQPQLGTGHAVMAAAPALAGHEGTVLILCGDVPGLRQATLADLLAAHQSQGNDLTVLAMDLPDPGHYGRLIMGEDGGLKAIREFRDATEAERGISLVNTGIYAAQAGPLWQGLPALATDNDQGEYYLTDLVEILAARGCKIGYALCPDPKEVAGVNSQAELAVLEKSLLARAGDRMD